MKKLLFWLLLVFGAILANAQEIKITIDENGKIESIPTFQLQKQHTYKCTVVVRHPAGQHKALLSFFKDKLEKTFIKLDDEAYPNAGLYRYLWGSDFDELKRQTKSLIDVLGSADPKAGLSASGESFSLFNGKMFLIKNLFGDIFTIHFGFDGIKKNAPLDQDYTYPFNLDTKENDTVDLPVHVADLTKQFLRNYFLAARSKVAATLDTIHTKGFYTRAVQLKSLNSQVAFLLDILSRRKGIVCDTGLVNPVKRINTDGFIALVKTGWMKQWIQPWLWYTEGDMTLNPLGFTDENFLVSGDDYDEEKAVDYNAYRDSVVRQILYSHDISAARMDFKTFDSLLSQKNRGAEVFNNQAAIEKAKQENKAAAKNGQEILMQQTLIRFVVYSGNEKEKQRLRIYDAAKSLTGWKTNEHQTVSSAIDIVAVAYNVPAKQQFKATNNATEIPDQSNASKEIDAAVDQLSKIGAASSGIAGVFAQLIGSFGRRDNVPIPSVVVPNRTGGPHLPAAPGFIDYMLKDSRRLLMQRVGDESIEYDIIGGVRKQLKDDSTCASLVEDIVEDIRSHVRPGLEIMGDDLSDLINASIASVYRRYQAELLRDDLQAKKDVYTILSSQSFYTLPARGMKENKSSDPLFRTALQTIESDDKARKNTLDLTLVNSEGKAVISKKDIYKTAPTHWLQTSLGVAYVINDFKRTEATIENGVIKSAKDEDQVRLLAGIHIYPWPIILADNRNVFQLRTWDEVRSRLSVFAGLSFPKPLYNVHVGVGMDVWTGVRLCGGVHLYRYTAYSILNNQIIDEKNRYVYNGAFISLGIGPEAFAKLIGIVK
jgi:predicted thioredoxin/glutaredoxin